MSNSEPLKQPQRGQLTKDIHYFANYFLKRNPVKHSGKCKSETCVNQRNNNRVAPRDMYTSGKYGVCNDCETPYPSSLTRCPCCSHILRKKSKYRKAREPDIVRY